jgi:hypothetical protein
VALQQLDELTPLVVRQCVGFNITDALAERRPLFRVLVALRQVGLQ